MHDGFESLEDGVFKGKGLSALKLSENGRSRLISFFGGVSFLPSSVMKTNRKDATQDDDKYAHERGYDTTSVLAKKMGKTSYDRNNPIERMMYSSGRGCSAGALSRFPQDVGRTALLFYSNPGGTVFDPFAGHNSRMDLCVTNGRHYTGCDLSTNFMDFNFKRADVLRKKYPLAKITLHHCDSRKVPASSESADFTITSPPYWDIEYYGDEPEQLGKCKSYEGFLRGLKKVLRENHRVLKPGAYATWFVNDFRRKGRMHFYHADLIRLGEEVGFVAHDILIVDLGRSMRGCFINQAVQQRILPKRHEYGIIFRKKES